MTPGSPSFPTRLPVVTPGYRALTVASPAVSSWILPASRRLLLVSEREDSCHGTYDVRHKRFPPCTSHLPVVTVRCLASTGAFRSAPSHLRIGTTRYRDVTVGCSRAQPGVFLRALRGRSRRRRRIVVTMRHRAALSHHLARTPGYPTVTWRYPSVPSRYLAGTPGYLAVAARFLGVSVRSRSVSMLGFGARARRYAAWPYRGRSKDGKNTSPGLGKRRPRCRGRVKGREGYLTRKLTICEYGRGVFFTRALNWK